MISIGIPCYNEEENIEEMYNTVTQIMKELGEQDYEILYADNASEDRSEEILRKIAENDKHVKVILNQVNYGPGPSSVNLIDKARGDAYIGLPCDFQEPPEMIGEFIKYWREGYNVVLGQKAKSKENPIKYALRKLYYGIISFFSDEDQLDQVTGFGLLSREALNVLIPIMNQDPQAPLRNLLPKFGFKTKLIPYEQQERRAGKSSYNASRYFDFAIISLCNASTKPLRFMTILGISLSAVSALIGIVYFIYKILHWDSFGAGVAPIVIGLFFISSVQLFCIGMLGEYISIILRRVTVPVKVVDKELLNFEDK